MTLCASSHSAERARCAADRKLLESFLLMDAQPQPREVCVDLGACPGGWTAALRRQCGASVTAVDRQPLAPALMADESVNFVQGDAFSFEPGSGGADWMVSDGKRGPRFKRSERPAGARGPPGSPSPVHGLTLTASCSLLPRRLPRVRDAVAAYPERCVELVEAWCRHRWARQMVVTMKFTGVDPDFEAIEAGRVAAERHGYLFRAMHHFSNKNEVTLMLRSSQHGGPSGP